MTCGACPLGSTAMGSPTSCTCNQNFVAFYSAAALVCQCGTGFNQFGTGSTAVCILPSPTPSSTAAVSPTPSPSVTASQTATPSLTPSNTMTPSQTPSHTTVPDVLLYFAIDIVPLNTALPISYITSNVPGLYSQASVLFANLLGQPLSSVYATNISDLATGAFVPQGAIRRLGDSRALAPASGSQGVAITFVVRLGKTPQQAAVANMSTVLSTLVGGPLTSISAILASVTSLPASDFVVSVNLNSIVLLNAPFSLSGGGSSSSTTSSGNVGGAAGGGIAAAIVLVIGIWSWRSYAKHGKLPCCRDRRRESLVRHSIKEETIEVSSAIAEAEKALQRDSQAQAGAALYGGRKPNKALIVQRLVEKAAREEVKAAKAAAEANLLREAAKARKVQDLDELTEEELEELQRKKAAKKAAKRAAAEAEAAERGRAKFDPIVTTQ